MGYLHINNLYRAQDILMFRECWALEKVHGTSAHVAYTKDQPLRYFPGGGSMAVFGALFDPNKLFAGIEALGHENLTIYGEFYGGGGNVGQGMKDTYGPKSLFIVFDVQINGLWLSVPDMDSVATALGLEVVPYEKIEATLEAMDAARDKPSEVAKRRGMGDDKPREGVVLRPLVELRTNNGDRVICKHRLEKFSERATPQKIMDSSKLAVIAEAKAIADEWVTPMRLVHVLDKMPEEKRTSMAFTKDVITAMIEDVYREAKGEIVESKDAEAAIGKRTAILFKERLAGRA